MNKLCSQGYLGCYRIEELSSVKWDNDGHTIQLNITPYYHRTNGVCVPDGCYIEGDHGSVLQDEYWFYGQEAPPL